MAQSSVLDWTDEQTLRAYPLKENFNRVTSSGFVLKDNVLLDAQLVYDTIPSPVELVGIVVSTTDVTFEVTGGLVFTVPKTGPWPYYARLSQGSLLVVGEECLNIPEDPYTLTNVPFESTVVYEMGGAWKGVDSLTFDSSAALTGELTFKEGFQYGIAFSGSTILMSAGSQYGTPVDCTTASTVTNDCADIISYINGISPDGNHKITFSRGNGIVILDDPTNHRIFVGLTFQEGDICKTIPSNPES